MRHARAPRSPLESDMSFPGADDLTAVDAVTPGRDSPECPKCSSRRVSRLPDVAPHSPMAWFQCRLCAHLWPTGGRRSD